MSSHEVEFNDVCRRIGEFGDRATLITVTDSGTPHVVSAVIEIGDGRLRARVGPRTRQNLTERPTMSLLWEPTDEGEYQMILDCRADDVGDPLTTGVSTISIEVEGGILHRLAELPGMAPSCIVLSA